MRMGDGPGPARRSGQWLIVAVVIAVVLIAGFVAWQRRHPPVVLFGDSITEITKPAFEREFGGGYKLTVSGKSGDRVDQRVPVVAELAGGHPEQVVINLGTNDVLQNWPLDQTVQTLEQIGGSFAGARCVHLTTVTGTMFSLEDTGMHDRAAELNRRLRALADRHDWHIIPWDEVVSVYDASGSPKGPWSSDTVHPTPEVGQPMLIDAYRKALDGCA